MRLSDFVGPALAPIAVATAFALLRKYLPARETVLKSAPISARESANFRKVGWIVGASIFGIGAAFATVLYETLLLANRYFAEADGPARFRLLPSNAIWMFLPGFGAVCLAWEITLFLWLCIGNKEEIARYVEWSHEKAGFNSTRALRWMAVGIVMPIGIATLLAIPIHTSLGEQDVTIRGYGLRSVRRYPYSQARRLSAIGGFRGRDGTFTPRAEILIDFSDGYRWHSGDNRDFAKAIDPEVAAFLEKKTGLTLERYETETEMKGISWK